MEINKKVQTTAERQISIWSLRLLVFGSLVSLASGIATFFLKSLFESILIVLVTEVLIVLIAVITELVNMNRRISEHDRYINETIFDGLGKILLTADKIYEKMAAASDLVRIEMKMAKAGDPITASLYGRLVSAIKSLEQGTYKLNSLEEVYKDDEQSIKQLQHGDILRSTCPIDYEQPEEQIKHRGFEGSIQAHLAAAKRGVIVQRLYLIPNRSLAYNEEIRNHLIRLQKGGITVRVAFKEQKYRIDQMLHHDFLIFGNNKVSVGIPNTSGWIIRGAWVVMTKEAVDLHAHDFDLVFAIADRLGSLYENIW